MLQLNGNLYYDKKPKDFNKLNHTSEFQAEGQC